MHRYTTVLLGAMRVLVARSVRNILGRIGRRFLEFGKMLIAKSDHDDGWKHQIFLRCFLVDLEVCFSNGVIVRGPMYALYPSTIKKRVMVAKLNWVAQRALLKSVWKYEGAYDLLLPGYRSLQLLPNGDAWFAFDGGHAVLYLGEPKERLHWSGASDVIRQYLYF